MNANVNFPAPLGALMFLGLVAGTVVLVLAGAFLTVRGQRDWAKRVWWLLGAGIGTYVLLLAGFSFTSKEVTLHQGQEKYFCEIDCHLAYSIAGVERTRQIGDAKARGEFYVVRLRTRFDETTISERRPKDATLFPNPREAVVIDDAGRRIEGSEAGTKAAEASGKFKPLMQPLLPGESYESVRVFDLPADIKNPRLLLRETMGPTPFVIGHENSVGHKKVYFAL